MKDPNQSLKLGSYVSYMVVSRSIRLESFLPPLHAGKRHGKSLPCWENWLNNSYAIWFSWYGCLVWASHLWSIQAARLRMQMLLLRVLVLHVYLIEAEWKVIDTLLFLGWQAPSVVPLYWLVNRIDLSYCVIISNIYWRMLPYKYQSTGG